MKHGIVVGVALAALVAGCGGDDNDDAPETQAERPAEGLQGNDSAQAAPAGGFKVKPTQDNSGATTITSRINIDVPNNRIVSLVGGGGRVDNSYGSFCTTDETNRTWKTGTDFGASSFGFKVNSDGECFVRASWSYFIVTVKDLAGNVLGRGERLWIGQPLAGGSFYVTCEHTGDDDNQPKAWDRLKCREPRDALGYYVYITGT